MKTDFNETVSYLTHLLLEVRSNRLLELQQDRCDELIHLSPNILSHCTYVQGQTISTYYPAIS